MLCTQPNYQGNQWNSTWNLCISYSNSYTYMYNIGKYHEYNTILVTIILPTTTLHRYSYNIYTTRRSFRCNGSFTKWQIRICLEAIGHIRVLHKFLLWQVLIKDIAVYQHYQLKPLGETYPYTERRRNCLYLVERLSISRPQRPCYRPFRIYF